MLFTLLIGCTDPTGPAENVQRFPPETITDLEIKNVTTSRVELSWTAPEADTPNGKLYYTKIRYATFPVTDSTWDSATDAGVVYPRAPSSGVETFTITLLKDNKTYHFGVLSGTIYGAESGVSNSVSATLPRQEHLAWMSSYTESDAAWLYNMTPTLNGYLLLQKWIPGSGGFLSLPVSIISVLDISDAVNPSIFILGWWGGGSEQVVLTTYGRYVYMVPQEDLYVPQTPPKLHAKRGPPGSAFYGSVSLGTKGRRYHDPVTNGQNVFLASSGSLAIVDVSNSSAPKFLGYDTSFSGGSHLELIDTLLIVAGNRTVELASVSDPLNIKIIGTYHAGGNVTDMTISGDIMFLETTLLEIEIVDIANPAAPVKFSSYSVGVNSNDMIVARGNLIVVDSLGIQLIDISDPTAPSLKTIYDLPVNGKELAVTNNILYVSDGDLIRIHILIFY